MKAAKLLQNIGLVAFGGLVFSLGISAQEVPSIKNEKKSVCKKRIE